MTPFHNPLQAHKLRIHKFPHRVSKTMRQTLWRGRPYHGIPGVTVERVGGELSDHYDPRAHH